MAIWQALIQRVALAVTSCVCLGSCAPRSVPAEQPPPQVSRREGVLVIASSDAPAGDSIGDIELIEVLHDTGLVDRMRPTVRRRMLETLEEQRRLWQERRPRQYVIRIVELSGCHDVRTGPYSATGELLRDRLVIRDSTIVRHEAAPMPAAYAQRCLVGWRVDDLFADVARILADPAAKITGLEYDAAYGFPRAYWPDRGGRDYGRGVLVESFAPAP